MSTISDKERYLIARGDVAIVALKAVLNLLEPTRDTNERTATQLQAVQAKQPQGNVTLLSIVTQVATQTSLSLASATETIKQALHEIDYFSSETEQENSESSAVSNVINAIRQSSEIYANKSDDEIKQIIGL
jgi:hypothetical protein|nr:MAG TPA: hypothetical protein [Caudoviricetes sp.]DAX19087.1 MAG TPA: hypothetical protein [Caudoviricetes sp.]DAY27032.1 MAG TPA: hypothetical protein [Caudoviricetes sp.]